MRRARSRPRAAAHHRPVREDQGALDVAFDLRREIERQVRTHATREDAAARERARDSDHRYDSDPIAAQGSGPPRLERQHVRKLLNRLLRPLGYQLERISPFERALAPLIARPGGFRFVQIGANDGVRFDGLFTVVTTHAASGVVVEPLPDMFERLRANYADYPRVVPVNRALHATAATLPLYHVASRSLGRYPGWASGIASFDRGHLIRHAIAPDDIEAAQVECVRLMDLLAAHALLDADLLQIDTEGYDGEILRMIDFTRLRPRVIKFEHKNLAETERAALATLLATNGYALATENTDTVASRD